jgi:DNA repair protein RecO (recombination protein O)
MAAHSAEGVILRRFYLRETSYVLVVFTKEFGKVRGVIKGVRAPYPQFAGNYELFTRCSLLFYKKKKKPLDLITQCETLESFQGAKKEIERLTYANYFIELIDVVTEDYDVNEEVYRVLVESLRMLSGTSSAKRVSRIFEIKVLSALGMEPQLDGCTVCAAPLEGEQLFSAASGGVVCSGCAERDRTAVKVSAGVVKFMRKIIENDLDRVSHIKVSKEVGLQTEAALKSFLRYHVNRPMRSLGFLEQMEKTGVVKI